MPTILLQFIIKFDMINLIIKENKILKNREFYDPKFYADKL